MDHSSQHTFTFMWIHFILWLCLYSVYVSIEGSPKRSLIKEPFWAFWHPHQIAPLAPALFFLRPLALGVLFPCQTLRCVNTCLDTHACLIVLTVFPPQSACLSFRARRLWEDDSCFHFQSQSHYLWSFSLLHVSLSLSLRELRKSSVCGQRYILCKVDLEMANTTWRSCSFCFSFYTFIILGMLSGV